MSLFLKVVFSFRIWSQQHLSKKSWGRIILPLCWVNSSFNNTLEGSVDWGDYMLELWKRMVFPFLLDVGFQQFYFMLNGRQVGTAAWQHMYISFNINGAFITVKVTHDAICTSAPPYHLALIKLAFELSSGNIPDGPSLFSLKYVVSMISTKVCPSDHWTVHSRPS